MQTCPQNTDIEEASTQGRVLLPASICIVEGILQALRNSLL
jgi:hypothetical protein